MSFSLILKIFFSLCKAGSRILLMVSVLRLVISLNPTSCASLRFQFRIVWKIHAGGLARYFGHDKTIEEILRQFY